MANVRFVRMAQALARAGHNVDLVLNRLQKPQMLEPRLREISFRFVKWSEYDVIKTSFHVGFESLLIEGGGDHPFIVSKLGSVVGATQTDGVHFYGPVRERLFRIQEEIARRSRVVTVLTSESAQLWKREHRTSRAHLMMVPTGVDVEVPRPRENPYRAIGIECPVAIFAGNLYARQHQPEVNAMWQERLNRIGRLLKHKAMQLVAMGSGETNFLDREAVRHVGQIEADEFWNWQQHAAVGLVLAQGIVQDNESSKIYYYLRTGLPVVCERPVPNSWLVDRTGHGAIVDYDDVEAIADATVRLSSSPPSQNGIADYIVREHSWDRRAAAYAPIFAQMKGEAASSR